MRRKSSAGSSGIFEMKPQRQNTNSFYTMMMIIVAFYLCFFYVADFVRNLSKVPFVYYIMNHISTGARIKEKTFARSSAAAA